MVLNVLSVDAALIFVVTLKLLSDVILDWFPAAVDGKGHGFSFQKKVITKKIIRSLLEPYIENSAILTVPSSFTPNTWDQLLTLHCCEDQIYHILTEIF